jgi:hypothetical protein
MNIHFKSEKGISKDEFLKILQKEYEIKKRLKPIDFNLPYL